MAHAQKRTRGVTVARPIVVGNSSVLLSPKEKKAHGDRTHRWTFAIRSAASPDSDLLDPAVDPSGPGSSTFQGKGKGKRSPWDQIGGADDLGYLIKKVQFTLHPTFTNPTRVVDRPPFQLTETCYAEFDLGVKIFFPSEAGEKPVTLTHWIKITPWQEGGFVVRNQPGADEDEDEEMEMDVEEGDKEGGSGTGENAGKKEEKEKPKMTDEEIEANWNPTPVHSWRYDELVFNEPTEAFYKILLQHPPTPLPAYPRWPARFGWLDKERREMEEVRKEKVEEAERQRLRAQEKEGGRQRVKENDGAGDTSMVIDGGHGGSASTMANPKSNLRPRPKPSDDPTANFELDPWDLPLSKAGNIGELSVQTEWEEADRLDEARMKVAEMVEKLRDRMMESESELMRLQREVGDT